MTRLLYQGHGSFRIETNTRRYIYVDPYVGDGYEKPADFILVTHQHSDHNQVDLVNKKATCVIITQDDLHPNEEYLCACYDDIRFQAVEAYNDKHRHEECVGYIIEVDGLKIYAAGDTSLTTDMKKMATMNLDYALLPTDGIYNMDVIEAAKCASIIKAKHTIPIHTKPGTLFDIDVARRFVCDSALIVHSSQEIDL